MTRRCGCSPTATAPTARRSSRRSSPTSPRAFSISTSPWPTTARTPMCTVKLVRDRDLHAHHRDLLRQRTGAGRFSTSLDPQCLSGFRKNEKFEIEHSDVILTVDNGDFVFFDCAYEELLQSLGPINDTSRALDHVQRQCVDGLFRRLRPVSPQPALRSPHQGRHDRAGGQGGAAGGARRRARLGEEGREQLDSHRDRV